MAILLMLSLAGQNIAIAGDMVPQSAQRFLQPSFNAPKLPKKQKPKSVNISMNQAARRATKEYGGEVLSVILEQQARIPYYQIKLLESGKIRVVHITAHK